MLFQEEPDYSLLRPFGCLAHAVDLRPSKGKFDARSLKCVFLGYDIHHKGFTLYNLENHNIFVSRDVKFLPTQFPYITSPFPSDHGVSPPNPSPTFLPISSDSDTHYAPPSSPSLVGIDHIVSLPNTDDGPDDIGLSPMPTCTPPHEDLPKSVHEPTEEG